MRRRLTFGGRGRFTASPPRALERVGTPADVLRRHGYAVRGRMASCVFHIDNTPSMSLFVGADGKHRFRCHGCDARGDALDLEAHLSGRPLEDVIREWSR